MLLVLFLTTTALHWLSCNLFDDVLCGFPARAYLIFNGWVIPVFMEDCPVQCLAFQQYCHIAPMSNASISTLVLLNCHWCPTMESTSRGRTCARIFNLLILLQWIAVMLWLVCRYREKNSIFLAQENSSLPYSIPSPVAITHMIVIQAELQITMHLAGEVGYKLLNLNATNK